MTDPAAAELTLSINYRGGVRVWLNGVEAARQHLPAGDISDDTPGELYPNEAWVDGSGKVIGYKDPKPAVRDRAILSVKLPASAVRKGVNVLAVELRRSPFHPVALAWNDSGHPPSEERWVPISLAGVKLKSSGAGATPNVARPAGLQVWTHDRNNQVTVNDRGDPAEALYPVKIVGARNGSYCGQVGVGSDSPIKGLKAEAGDLKQTGGSAVIAASNIAILYGMAEPGNEAYDERLAESPPAQVALSKASAAAVLPVVVRVRIPVDAAPGEYTGQVTVSAAGQAPVSVPVQLHVADFKLPDPKDYRTFASIYQSPETIATAYKVDIWSEQHFKLLDKSWQLLGRAANKVVIINAVEQTQFGNDYSTIFWIKKSDGSYDWDFSVFDRYMTMALKHCGRLDHVALQMVHVGNIYNSKAGWAGNPIDQVVSVTVKDPATGKLESLKAPLFDTKEARAFWKPYLAAVSARLDKLGGAPLKSALCVGILMDVGAPLPMVKMFDEIWPDGKASRWMRGCHVATNSPSPYPVIRGAEGVVVLHEHCYGGGVRNAKLGESRGFPGAYYFRNSIAESRIPLTAFMTFGDYCLYLVEGHKGIGRICLDYWSMGRGGRLFNRFPYSDCMQRAPTICALSWQGPDGALPTQRFEALAEGLQECEAVIVLAEALDKSADKLGPELAQRCRTVIDDRRRYADLAFCELENRSYGWAVPHPNHFGWQDITRRLYDCAAEASAKVGK